MYYKSEGNDPSKAINSEWKINISLITSKLETIPPFTIPVIFSGKKVANSSAGKDILPSGSRNTVSRLSEFM